MTPPGKPLSGQIALVTGASRGIGAETAMALAEAGAHVVLVARTVGGLEDVETRVHQRGGSATIAPLDLAQHDGIDQLAKAVGARWGRLDILVLNAGLLGSLSPVSHIEPASWDKVFAVNVTAPFRLLRAFDGLLRATPQARVVALTTTVATQPRAYWGAYAASKAALENLVDTYGEEVRNVSGIRVAVVNPGPVKTQMRAAAYPGEDPDLLPEPIVPAMAILNLVAGEFETGRRLNLKPGQ